MAFNCGAYQYHDGSVEGLKNIHVYDAIGASVYFEFEDDTKLECAKNAILQAINEGDLAVRASNVPPNGVKCLCGFSIDQSIICNEPIRTADDLIERLLSVVGKVLNKTDSMVEIKKFGLESTTIGIYRTASGNISYN